MKTKLLLLYIAGLLAVCPMGGNLMAQTATQPDVLKNDTVSHKLIHRLGLDVRPSYVTPTNDFFDGDNMHQQRIRQALSVHLKYAFQFDKNSSLGRLYPHAYQGIGVSYNTFFCPSELGNPIAVYAFQGSRIAQLSPRLSFDYEWNFGASFGWKKYDRTYNPQNEVIGSKINAYINLGFFLNWQLNSQWSLTAGMDFTHYSNGNTHYPNSGVNPIGGRVGIVRTFGDGATTVQGFKSLSIKPYISYDLVVYGATRKRGFVDGYDVCLVPGSFGIVGLNFNPMYNFNKYFRAGVSVDAQYDESANIKDYRVEESSSSDVKFASLPKPILNKLIDKAMNSSAWSDEDKAIYEEKKSNMNYLFNFLSKEAAAALAELAMADKDAIVSDKIFKGLADGRVSKQLKEICLLDQTYVKAEDGKQTVAKYLESVNKALTIAKVVRFEVGEGMEKKNEDFAAEVAAQMKG